MGVLLKFRVMNYDSYELKQVDVMADSSLLTFKRTDDNETEVSLPAGMWPQRGIIKLSLGSIEDIFSKAVRTNVPVVDFLDACDTTEKFIAAKRENSLMGKILKSFNKEGSQEKAEAVAETAPKTTAKIDPPAPKA